jgi:hypothetical protein
MAPFSLLRSRWSFAAALALVTLVTLAPWWRQHGSLRDFFDYGLVMSGVGRIAAGERPYVDFTTPIQTGTFIFNGWAEGGSGRFQAMTRGAAALVILSMAVLALGYARRWPAWAALLAAAAITALGAAQHTIIWHNSLGAFLIAVVALSGAVAPLWRSETWPWHALLAVALAFSGINKLNAHLVALACAGAWCVRAMMSERGQLRRGLATVGAIALFGVALPLAFELIWTGAPLSVWAHNVIFLPLAGRSAGLRDLAHWGFYWSAPNDFYGRLPLPQLGALGLWMSAAVFFAGWKKREDRAWLALAALFSAAAGAALLATNFEIAYVALAAWVALVAALWIGFAVPARGAWFGLGFALPVALLGVVAWQSAWTGQRSQFGHTQSARASYVRGEELGAEFRYLRGTSVPPEVAASLRATAEWHAKLDETARAAIFYGPGLEWLERVWPARKVTRLPLWRHVGTSYGAEEEENLLKAIAPGGVYRHILLVEAWDTWGDRIEPELRHDFLKERLGQIFYVYRGLPQWVLSARPLEFLEKFGGNTDSTRLFSTMTPHALADGRAFVGTAERSAELRLEGTTYRMSALAVVRRSEGASGALPPVRFEAFANERGQLTLCWSGELALAEGQPEAVLAARIEPGGHPVLFRVTVPDAARGKVAAGWRELTIAHSAEEAATAPFLVPGASRAEPAGLEKAAALLPADWEPPEVLVRDARLTDGRFVLPPGGEVWIKLTGFFAAIEGTAEIVGRNDSAIDPVVRVIFYKGGRLEMLAQVPVRGGAAAFRAWSPEADGWLGILVDNKRVLPPVALKITTARRP